MINFYITLSCGLRAWGKSFQKENSRFDLESDTSSFRFFSKYLSRMLFIEVLIFYLRHFCFQLQRYHHLTNWFLFIYILHILIEWKDRMRAKYFFVRFNYFASNHTTTALALPSLPISAFFLVEPPTQSRAAFPSPPPSTFAFDYFASNHTTTALALPSLPISAFFLVEPPTQSRAAFPSPPPPPLWPRLLPLNEDFFLMFINTTLSSWQGVLL